jgi:hypothetical protein
MKLYLVEVKGPKDKRYRPYGGYLDQSLYEAADAACAQAEWERNPNTKARVVEHELTRVGVVKS